MQTANFYGPDGSLPRDRFADGYDESMEQTIRPNRSNRQSQSIMAAFDITASSPQSPHSVNVASTHHNASIFEQSLPTTYDQQTAANWQKRMRADAGNMQARTTASAGAPTHGGHRRGRSVASKSQVNIRPRPSPAASHDEANQHYANNAGQKYAMRTPNTTQGQFDLSLQTPPIVTQAQMSIPTPFTTPPGAGPYPTQFSPGILSPAVNFNDFSNFLNMGAFGNDMGSASAGMNPMQTGEAHPSLLPAAEMRPQDQNTPHVEQPETPPTPESSRSEASVHGYDDLDIDWTQAPALPRMIDTGISEEQINEHMKAPEYNGDKWHCKFADCTRTFGRKENIRSHVQTHLNDRRYGCRVCEKDHVRSHDHKRHYLTSHTDQKPFMCPCKQRFGRLDALKRHRSRGLCPGAYDGVKRTPAKRGRPRKDRPDMVERTAKATRTRQKNLSISSISSFSSVSDMSSPGMGSPGMSSPSMEWDNDPAVDGLMNDFTGFTTVPMSMQHPYTAPMPGAGQSSTHSSHTVINNIPSHPGSPQTHVSPVALERSESHTSHISEAVSHSSSTTYGSLFSEPLEDYLMYPTNEVPSLDVGMTAMSSEHAKFYTEEEFDKEIDNLFFNDE